MHKIYHFLFSLSVVFVLVIGNPKAGIGQTAEAHISADSPAAGDLVTFSITLSKDQQYNQVIFPDSTFFGGNFELRSRKQFRVAGFKDSLAYELQFWGVEDDTIAALPVMLVAGNDTTTIFTEPVPIAFRSVIESENPELRPLKPIFDFARAWWAYIIIILLLVIAAAIAYYYYKKKEEKPEPAALPEFKPKPFLNPLRELENNLRQLKDIPESGQQNYKQFYIDLGDAIRLYFEQMYHIAALESTSREIIDELNRRAVDDRLIADTRIVLREADMVKFAKFQPTKKHADDAFSKAEDFLSTVQTLHHQRIQMLRRQYLEKIEKERRQFNSQKQEEQV